MNTISSANTNLRAYQPRSSNAGVSTSESAGACALPDSFRFGSLVGPDEIPQGGCFGGGGGETPPTPPPPGTPKKWTVMIYSGSDNNLYRYMQTDLDEAEKVGTTANMNLIAETDHAPKGGGVQRIELQADQSTGLKSPVKEDLGSKNTADPKQLSSFIQWGMKNYPAENYMLIISDHGGGWQGAVSDDSHHGWMTLPMLEEGLKDAREATGKKIDVLGFDACLMASTEVAHQLKDECSYLVGSEETEGGAGWTYNRVLSERTLGELDLALRNRFTMGPAEVATHVVNVAESTQGDLPTMSAIDTSKVGALSAAVDNFAGAILASDNTAGLSRIADQTQGFYDFKDLYDFASRVKNAGGDLAASAEGVMQAVDDAVIAEQHSKRYPGAHGLTIELSKQYSHADLEGFEANRDRGGYKKTSFAQETRWDEAVAKIRG